MAIVDQSIIIIGQSKTSQTERLTDFYKKKYKYLVSIAFDSIFKKNLGIRIVEYYYGNEIDSKIVNLKNSLPKNELHILFIFTKLFFKIIFIVLKKNKKFEISIGIALFSSLVCMTLKILKKTNKFIYFFLDYYEPTNGVINFIYNSAFKTLDKIVSHSAFKIWSISYRLAKIKKTELLNKSLIIQNGCKINQKIPTYNKSSKKIAFLGTLSDNHALIPLFKIMRKLNNNFGVSIDIIGDGPYKKKFEEAAKKEKVENLVNFHGFIESYDDINNILNQAAICYCVWTNTKSDNSTTADPGKPKYYAQMQKPVIISDNVYSSKYFKKFNAGMVVKSNKEDIEINLLKFFSNEKLKEEMAINTKYLVKIWNNEKILERSYKSIQGS